MESVSTATVILSGSAPWLAQVEAPPIPWPIDHGHFAPHNGAIVQAFQAGSALAICDGSYMPWRYPQLAAAAWIIHSSTPYSAVCHGVTQVHGQPTDVNSYRAELQGMLSLLTAINHICMLHQLSNGSLLIGCDNKGVLRQIGKRLSYVPGSAKHADLL